METEKHSKNHHVPVDFTCCPPPSLPPQSLPRFASLFFLLFPFSLFSLVSFSLHTIFLFRVYRSPAAQRTLRARARPVSHPPHPISSYPGTAPCSFSAPALPLPSPAHCLPACVPPPPDAARRERKSGLVAPVGPVSPFMCHTAERRRMARVSLSLPPCSCRPQLSLASANAGTLLISSRLVSCPRAIRLDWRSSYHHLSGRGAASTATADFPGRSLQYLIPHLPCLRSLVRGGTQDWPFLKRAVSRNDRSPNEPRGGMTVAPPPTHHPSPRFPPYPTLSCPSQAPAVLILVSLSRATTYQGLHYTKNTNSRRLKMNFRSRAAKMGVRGVKRTNHRVSRVSRALPPPSPAPQPFFPIPPQTMRYEQPFPLPRGARPVSRTLLVGLSTRLC